MRKATVAFLLLGAVGLGVFAALYTRVFPTAALAPQITQRRAAEIAREYLAGRGIAVGDYKRATVFAIANDEAVFLQRTWGIERFNEEIVRDPYLAPWQFESRFFRPLQKEEFLVGVSPWGEVVAFYHTLEEAAPGAHLNKAEAAARAEAFLRDELAVDPVQYVEREYREQRLAARTDHHFAYELKGARIPEEAAGERDSGARRITVTVQGDQIGAFERSVFVPETFMRALEQEDASGTLYVTIAGFLEILLLILGFAVVLRGYKAGDLQSRPFYWIALALLVLSLVGALASLDELYMGYPTATPWANYLAISALVLVAVLAVITAVQVLVSGIAGERLTRAYFPEANDFGQWRSGDPAAVWNTALIGIGSGLIFLGYVAAFYYIGTRYFGIWSPIAPEIASYMGSSLPFLVPFILSMSAAVTEELAFRYLGVSLAKRYVRHTLAALVIPAVIWAFLHSTYPVYPLYVRGIELTIAGVFLGYIFIRHGILAAIAAHYVINAVLFSVPLLRSSDAYLRTSGALAVGLVIVIPIAYILAGKAKIKYAA